MNNNLIVDVSFPDDVFMINIKVESLNNNIYQLSYEADDQFIGLLEMDKKASACKLTGKVSLSEFQLKLLHESIIAKTQPSPKKAIAGIW